ncbi:MAG: DUF433 domain-containing protein, partial [Bacteroidota bacterium]
MKNKKRVLKTRPSRGPAYNNRITVDPKVLAGKPIIRGSRISVEFLLELLG